jgi:YteA family regulatory protein
MEKEKLQYFKGKLINERARVLNLINQMKENGVVDYYNEMSSELSFYDNHPSDVATELFDKERGLALRGNEISIIKKIEDSLKNIENNTYGKCMHCGKDIIEERLEFIPYAANCVSCQKSIDNMKPAEQNNRPVEEDVIGIPFRYRDSIDVGVDAEDTYQAVESFNRTEDTIGYYDDDDDDNGYVEPIEKISNEQYKNQLPD